jgi:hypothetical protein
MNGKFTHYLITRFNVPVKNWTHDKQGNLVGHDSWMDHRLALFSRYCVPTVRHQRQPNFTWIIYLDPNTDNRYQQSIQTILHHVPQASLRYASDMEELLTDLRKVISESPADYVITSRLDNDDGLGKAYVQIVQEAFQSQHNCLINLDHGVVYDIRNRVLTELRQARTNHFTSLIEKRAEGGENLTVLGFPHTHPPRECVIMNLSAPYTWFKTIHERNLVSRTKGRPVNLKHILPYFAIDKKDLPVSFINTILYYVEKIGQRVKQQVKRKS